MTPPQHLKGWQPRCIHGVVAPGCAYCQNAAKEHPLMKRVHEAVGLQTQPAPEMTPMRAWLLRKLHAVHRPYYEELLDGYIDLAKEAKNA